jgi:DNA-binding response OmpR family regulator
MLPGMDGWELCGQLKKVTDAPVMILSARGRVTDVVRGLETGADSYLIKPFSIDELFARLTSLLRRSRLNQAPNAS